MVDFEFLTRYVDIGSYLNDIVKHKAMFPSFGNYIWEPKIYCTYIFNQYEEISKNYREIALTLLKKEFRELHYCGIEILIKNLKRNYRKDEINLVETFLITNSWWDSVDTISKYLLGQYLIEFPSETEKVIERFSNSENRWLNRSAILFQLGYKKNTNYELLFSECVKHSQSKEFFIQKAIGWALREYGNVNPTLVINFVNNTDLKPLSRKEAIRKLI